MLGGSKRNNNLVQHLLKSQNTGTIFQVLCRKLLQNCSAKKALLLNIVLITHSLLEMRKKLQVATF